MTARAQSSNNKTQRQSHRKHTVYIQNSSTLARREQEILKKGKAQAQGTVSTRSMTTATIGSNSTLNATFDDHHDNESARSFEYLGGTTAPEKICPQLSPANDAFYCDESTSSDDADDESMVYEEEESMDDEREWKRDNVLLEMLQEASEEETEVYEETSRRSSSSSASSYSSGYLSVDHDANSDEDDIIVDVDDDSFLYPPSMNSFHRSTVRENSDKALPRDIAVEKSVTSCRPHHSHRPPVAVVFEIDDYTSDSGALGEDSLIDFVRDFTEEMKDASADESVTRSSSQSNGNLLAARPSVRVFSTRGARRCDIKTMKQRVLSSETILSTILENRAKRQKENRVMPEHKELEIYAEENAASLLSNDSTVEENRPHYRRQFSKEMSTEDIVSSMRGEDILMTTPSIQAKRAPRSQNDAGVPLELTTTLNEEADRRRQRLQELRAKRQANEQGSKSSSLSTAIFPPSSSVGAHSNRSGQQQHQQTSLHPIMHNKPSLRRDESTTTGNTGVSTPTVPTSNLTHQRLRSHRARYTSSQPIPSRPTTLSQKKETGLGRFLSRFTGSKAPKKVPERAKPQSMTTAAACRAAVTAGGKPNAASAFPTPPRSAYPPAHAVSAQAIANTGRYYQPPAPQVQRYGRQRPLASSLQPKRLFGDDSTCTSVWGRCFDDEAASTAKAAAAWV